MNTNTHFWSYLTQFFLEREVTDFREICYLSIFQKPVEKIQAS